MSLFVVSEWSNANTFSLLSFQVSLFTAFIAFKAYRKFLVRKAQEKQLEVVLQLLGSIHASKNFMEIQSGTSITEADGDMFKGGMITKHPFSIFEMIELSEFTEDKYLYFYCLDEADDFVRWEFFKEFSTNPLLPLAIATELRNFDIRPSKQDNRFGTFGSAAIIIGNNKSPTPDTEIFYSSSEALSTTTGFKNAVLKLRTSITTWLHSYGIKDLNLSTR